ncbi:MAG: hypothetical protein IPI95_04660 [Flavobacteriales bacterium]|nr:hypothetical protein [Flavobacteriales bacterium]
MFLKFAVMREQMDHWWRIFPAGTGDVVVLLVQLIVALAVVGWAYNRGYRAHDRGPLLRLPLLTVSFGLALLVRSFHQEWWQPLVIAFAVIVAGFFDRNDNGRGLVVPIMLIATLLGLGLILSALVLTVVALLVFMLSPVAKR